MPHALHLKELLDITSAVRSREGEAYDEAAYRRAYKRAKRNPEEDNAKRRGRDSYNPDPREATDRLADVCYSRWA